MAASKATPAPETVRLRFIGTQRAQYWDRGWKGIGPGQEIELPKDRLKGMLDNGDWEQVHPAKEKDGE